MDVLKNTAFVLGVALIGASLGACNKNEGAGAAPAQPSAGQAAPAAAGPGYGGSSSSGGSGGSSSSSSGG